MAHVLVHPSGANTRGKVNWSKTLAEAVEFEDHPRGTLLTSEQRSELRKVHPTGAARFWGTFDEPWRLPHLESTGPGAAVVFTADSHARGIGVIGHLFKNAGFADTLWDPDPDKGSYAWVYSLASFEESEIHYVDLRRMLGLKDTYPFRRLHSVGGEQAREFQEIAGPPQAAGQIDVLEPVPGGNTKPVRKRVSVDRIVRSSAVTRWVKDKHDGRCQVCGISLVTKGGNYSEGAHVRALGGRHGGPDTPSNVLCLCPNDHVLFDAGAIYIADGEVFRSDDQIKLGDLYQVPGHKLSDEHISYHREHFAGIK